MKSERPREPLATEARMLAIVRASREAIITIDAREGILMFNPMAECIFGVSATDAIGTLIKRFIPERYRAAHSQHVAQFGAAGVSDIELGRRILYGLRANGEEFPIEASISQIDDQHGKLYTVMLRDVTDRIEAEKSLHASREELRALSANLQNVREEEKTRIARELHDDLGQQLTALKMDLSIVEGALAGLPVSDEKVQHDMAEQLRNMQSLVDATVASVRRIAADLRPVMLDDLGLVAAIEWLANDFTNRYGIEVHLRIEHGEVLFSREGATAMFRIVQEALTNVARHAHATQVMVAIFRDDNAYVISIEDNGRGVDTPLVPDGKSFGLLGMRERARKLGGFVTLDAARTADVSGPRAGKGFLVTARFPLHAVSDTAHPDA